LLRGARRPRTRTSAGGCRIPSRRPAARCRTDPDDEPVRRAREDVDESVHEVDVGRAEAAEREVYETALTRRDVLRKLEGCVRATDARVEPMPRRRERRAALVVHLGRRRGARARRAPARSRRSCSSGRRHLRGRRRRSPRPRTLSGAPGRSERAAAYPACETAGSTTRGRHAFAAAIATRAVRPATANASDVPPMAASQPASRPPTGARPRNAKR
jgi:hypothetical protein